LSIWTVSAGRIRYSMPALQHRLGGGLIVGDERHDTALPAGGRAQQQVDAAAGHRLTQAGQLAGLVCQLHGEGAHLMPPVPAAWPGNRR